MKNCSITTSEEAVQTHLFKELVINKNLEIINESKFNKIAEELKEQVSDILHIDSDVIYKNEKDNTVSVNTQVLDDIRRKKIGVSSEVIPTISYGNSEGQAAWRVAIDRIKTIIPGVNVKILSSEAIIQKYGRNADEYGFLDNDNNIILNSDKYSIDTPFHEYSHLALRFLKETDIEAYLEIVTKALEHPNRDNIRSKYPELSDIDLGEEIFVTEVGLKSAEMFLKDNSITGKIKGFFKEMVYKVLGRTPKNINLNDSIESYIEKWSYSLLNKNGIFNDLTPPQAQALLKKTSVRYSDDHMEKQLMYEGYIIKVNSEKIYLGKDGKRSKMYYDSIKKGDKPEHAKMRYLRYMNGVVGLKFKKLDTKGKKELEDRIKVLDTNHNNTKLDPNDVNSYIDTKNVLKRFNRSTSYIAGFKDPFIAEDNALQTIESEYRKEYEVMHPDEDPGEKKKNAREYATNKMAALSDTEKAAKIKEKIDIYDFKREVGTFTHVLTEDYVVLREKLAKAKKAAPGSNGYIIVVDPSTKKDVRVYTNDELISYEAKRPRVVKNDEGATIKDDNRDGGKYSPINNTIISGERHGLLLKLEEKLKKLEEKYGEMEYRTEVKVRSDELGFAGSIDLLAIEKGTGNVHIIDYKTKEKSKAQYWDKSFKKNKLTGKFDKYDDTAETAAAIQTSMYAIMLEELGFKVVSSRVLLIVGNLPVKDGNIDHDHEQYREMEIREKILPSMKGAILSEYESRNVLIDKESKDTKNDIIDTINNIAGGQDVNYFDPSEKYIDELYNAKTNVNGVDGWMYGSTFRPYWNDSNSGLNAAVDMAKKKKQIRSALSGREKLISLENDMEKLFNDPGYEVKPPARKVELLSIMRGISNDTHTIIKLSEDYAFGDEYVGMVLFVNKITGEGRFININSMAHSKLNFGKGFTSVMGKYMSDDQVSSETYAEEKYTNTGGTTESIKMLKVALVIAKLKKMNPEISIDYVISTPPLEHLEFKNSGNKSTMYDLHTLMKTAKKTMKLASLAGDVVGSVNNLIKDDRALDGEYYNAPFPIQLLHELESNVSKPSASKQELMNALEKFNNNEYTDIYNLIYTLNNFVRINTDIPYELKRTVLRTILHLKGFRTAAIYQDINALEKYLTIPSFTANLYINQIASVARGNKRKARVEYIDYVTDHNAALVKFIGEQSNPFRVGTPSSMKRIMNDGSHADPKQRYRFKSDSELAGDAEGLAYKKFFQNKLRKALLSTEETRSTKAVENIESYISNGYIPLISTGFKEKLAAAQSTDEAKQLVIEQVQKAGQSSEVREEDSWDMENVFASELGEDPIQGSDIRRRKLGIRDDGTLGKQVPYETDLSIILDRVVSESLMVKYGRDTLASGRALAFEAGYQKASFDHEARGVTLAIEMIAKVFVKGSTGQNIAEKMVGSFSTLATYVAIAGSLKSMILETVTNVANVAKLYIQEDLMGTLLNKKSRFKAADMIKAMGLMVTDGEKANLLMLHFGMKESDPRRLSKFMANVEKNKLFKADNLFGVQTAVLSIAQMEVMISIMLADGSYDAYTVVDNKLKYNIKADRRFFNADKSQTEKQKMLYKKVTATLAQEGKQNEDGTYQVGYIDEELNSIKDYAVEAFSSMDDDSRNAATTSIFGRLTGKFKTWVLPRVARIIGTPVEEQLSSSHWNYIYDDDGVLVDVIRQFDPAEGYLYTIGKLLKTSSSTGSLENFRNLDDFKKDQLAKLGADSIMVMLLLTAFQLVTCDSDTDAKDCWHKNSHLNSLFYKSLTDAPSDIFVPIVIYDTLAGRGSMAPAISITQRFIGNSIGAASELAHGNTDKAFEDIMKITSASKNIYEMTETHAKYLMQ